MDKQEIKKKVLEEEDYIKSPKYSNSLNKFMIRNSRLLTDATIARLLVLSEEEIENIYKDSVERLKKLMAESDE